MPLLTEDLIKLSLAALLGGLIGAEREYRDKAAGFRTLVLIAIGSTLFMILSLRFGAANDDTVRIAANIVTGIGFLGAGVILRGGGGVVGMTTAATVWVTAALGMAVGGGEYALALAAASVVLVVLWVLPIFEAWINNRRETRTYEIVCPIDPKMFLEMETMFHQFGLRVRGYKHGKRGDKMFCSWHCSGTHSAHVRATEALLADENIEEFTF